MKNHMNSDKFSRPAPRRETGNRPAREARDTARRRPTTEEREQYARRMRARRERDDNMPRPVRPEHAAVRSRREALSESERRERARLREMYERERYNRERDHEAAASRPEQIPHGGRHDQMRGSLLTFFYVFLFTLFAVGVLLIALPKQTVAEDENRVLQGTPVFSVKNWFSGEFAKQCETYFADHFPARQSLISVDRWAKGLTEIGGKSEDDVQFVSGKREHGKGDQRFITTAPNQDQPNKPESTAKVGGDQATVPAKTEPAPTEPAPTYGRELGQQFDFETQDGELSYQDYSVMIANGRAMEVFYTADSVEKDYADALNHLAAKLPADMRMFNILVPTAAEFYGPEEFRTGGYSQYDAINRVYRMLDERIATVDAYNELARHTKEYIYFRTDHHWNGAGAYYGYKAFCERAGLEPTPLKDMKKRVLDEPFLGTLYGMTNNNPQLKEFKDHAEFYFQKHQGKLVYYTDSTMSDGIQGVFMNPDIDMGNQYLMYTGGDVPLAHIKSTNTNGKSCVVFKESYGNAFAAYLVDNYEDIYLIDPRSFTDNVYPLLEQLGIDDVIVINYAFAMGNPYWMKGFKAITQ